MGKPISGQVPPAAADWMLNARLRLAIAKGIRSSQSLVVRMRNLTAAVESLIEAERAYRSARPEPRRKAVGDGDA